MHHKLYYAAGPGDVVGTFGHWKSGEDDPSELSLTYSHQFFELARALEAEALVVSSNARFDEATHEGIRVFNRPPKSIGKGKVSYWSRQIVAGIRFLADLIRFRPQQAIIAEGTAPWIFTLPAKLLGTEVIPALHCRLWPKDQMPNRLLFWLDRLAFRVGVRRCLCVSQDVADQVDVLTGGKTKTSIFYPSYRADLARTVPETDWSASPINLLYLGRLEADKGVFDLVSSFGLLEKRTPGKYQLHFCGDGNARAELEKLIADLDFGDRIHLHGHCLSESVEQHLIESHIICVPTKSCFVEGFNKVVAEGVLANRHVICTDACPAGRAFGDAVTTVEADNSESFADAIVAATQSATANIANNSDVIAEARDRLLNREYSWGNTLRNFLRNDSAPIGYLVPQFPSQTHAFFWRELTAMRDAGATIQLLSTRPPLGEECQHEFAAAARRETLYLSKVSLGALFDAVIHPIRTFRAISYISNLTETKLSGRVRALALIPCALQLCRIARAIGIQHVHLHSCADAGHIGALAKILGGPDYSLTLHGDLKVYGADHREKFAGANWVSAVTRPLQTQIVEQAGRPRNHVPVITMGVDIEQFTPVTRSRSADRPINLATIARIIPQKGHLHALEAISRARSQGVNVHYSIAGSGSFTEAVAQRIEELNLTDVVELKGSLSEGAVRELLDQTDVFILPSYGLGEAAPVSVMEAMACGLPVICSRIGGTTDMIDHLVDGWLVDQQDEDQLFEAITKLAEDSTFREAMGEAARKKALSHFDHHVNARRLLDCIHGNYDSDDVALAS